MSSRKTYLQERLKSAQNLSLVEILFKMFLAFPSSRQGVDTAEEMMKSYADILGARPLWAIEKAIKSLSTGAFAPAAGMIADKADEFTLGDRTELSKINKILNAKIIPNAVRAPEADRKAFAAEMVRKFRATMPASEPRADILSAQADLAAHHEKIKAMAARQKAEKLAAEQQEQDMEAMA